jgi:hypothetical protein
MVQGKVGVAVTVTENDDDDDDENNGVAPLLRLHAVARRTSGWQVYAGRAT